MFTNQRGIHCTEQKKINRALIKKYFRDTDGASIRGCAELLKLSYNTVLRHIKEIKEEG